MYEAFYGVLYRSCWSGHKNLVTGFFFRTDLGNLFFSTVDNRLVLDWNMCGGLAKSVVIGEKLPVFQPGYSIAEGRLASFPWGMR